MPDPEVEPGSPHDVEGSEAGVASDATSGEDAGRGADVDASAETEGEEGGDDSGADGADDDSGGDDSGADDASVTTPGDGASPYVSGWDPRIGASGIGDVASALLVDAAHVIVGGSFLAVRSTPANMLATFDPSTGTLTAVPNTLTGVQRSVNALIRYDGELVAGGSFAGGIAIQGATDFALLGGGVKSPGFVFALATDATRMWIGGNFVTSDNGAAYLTSWSGAAMAAVSYDPGPGILCLARDGDQLWAGGSFIGAVNSPSMDVRGIARYDLGSNTWLPIGSGATEGHGIGGRASVDAIVPTADFVYAAGDFAKMDGVPVANIARWRRSTSTWEALPNGGISGSVLDMAYDGTKLYIVGLFNQGGGVPAGNVVVFDTTTSTWSTLPDGGLAGQLKGYPPQVLDVEASGKDLYFVGDFATAGGLPSAGFAHYRMP